MTSNTQRSVVQATNGLKRVSVMFFLVCARGFHAYIELCCQKGATSCLSFI